MKGYPRLLAVLAAAGLVLAACSDPQGPGPTRRIPPPPPEQDVPETRGAALTPEQIEEIQRVVNVGRDSLNVCYTKELERRGNKDLVGKVLFKINIGTTSRALGVEIGADTTLKVPKVHTCMKAAVLTWEFPKLKAPFLYTTTVLFDPAY